MKHLGGDEAVRDRPVIEAQGLDPVLTIAPELETRWITDPAELAALSDQWERLLRESRSDTIFLTPEWTLAWLDAFGADHSLCTLAIFQGGDLVGLSLMSVRWQGVGRVFGHHKLRLAADGSTDCDYLDILSKPGLEERVVDATLSAIAQAPHGWSVLHVNEIPETSPNIGPIRTWIASRGWYASESLVPCAYLDLPSDWEAYLRTLKPRMRTKVRSLVKKLEGEESLVFDRCTDEAELPERLDSLYALHQSRWESRGEPGAFASSARRKFYHRMSVAALRRGWLRFYSLRIDGEFVAHQFCLERDGVMSLLQEGFDVRLADRGIGNALRVLVFREAMERGVAVYDFLAGVSSHKLSWGAVQKNSVCITASPPGPKGRAYFALRQARAWGRRQGKRTLTRLGLYRDRT